ncbi:hypothetical protein G4X40_18640 [Rhodococcus sp. D2-41]|uniref:hypothetical protein n=1 Tax=Speluncibacter jeojiensis TaxID=2710754 RepID=UPI002410A0DD|nr:hypothetical protein [Rhodococcus sp. D2-41]MDG3012164.1 hypothetical protein [Rhodococcus sp. D2-41]
MTAQTPADVIAAELAACTWHTNGAGDAHRQKADNILAALDQAGYMIADKPTAPFKADGFDFTGCTDRNPDVCACESSTDTECDRCANPIEDGQLIWQLDRVMFPSLPDGHDGQEWETHVWHDDCAAAQLAEEATR